MIILIGTTMSLLFFYLMFILESCGEKYIFQLISPALLFYSEIWEVFLASASDHWSVETRQFFHQLK